MPEPIDPKTPLSVMLTAQEWNSLMAILSEAPVAYRISAPLIQNIGQQLQNQAGPNGAPRD